jgi:hypothetical protein
MDGKTERKEKHTKASSKVNEANKQESTVVIASKHPNESKKNAHQKKMPT